ncbi:MAG: sorbosone dehydrogenase family protein [Candidatus Nitrosocosmicus sp.]|jgi:glucose/arabinose dehydrogenase|uniref:PQQ-dependent sugar dehydrogenase n=1 Tax=Candidatus Nitrosocosmicus sp. FF01 TaxID=3397670 RepID=UPI002A7413CC|nr:glucose dehydrogenase [Candidatus Nitrosocosmicus sp.]
MKKYTGIIIGIIVVVISVFTIANTPSDTTILLPSPNFEDRESAVRVMAEDLGYPTNILVLPDERMVLTEQTGKTLIFNSNGTLLNTIQLPDNYFEEGAGLLGLAADPQFASNHFLYLYYTYTDNNSSNIFNKVIRAQEKNNSLVDVQTIIDNIPASKLHNGGALKFGPDGKLYISVGDTTESELSQNLSSFAGKILRLNPDGTIPNDNPFDNSSIYSYGHRNVVGIAWDFNNNTMYATEAGSTGNDEINIIKSGENYGWPIEVCGTPEESLFVNAEYCFTPSVYPSGIIISNSSELNYYGKLLVATIKGEHLRSIDPITKDQSPILTGYGKIKDITEDKNGSLYIITNNRGFYDDSGSDRILKIIRNQ